MKRITSLTRPAIHVSSPIARSHARSSACLPAPTPRLRPNARSARQRTLRMDIWEASERGRAFMAEGHTDEEILQWFRDEWREAHPATTRFWYAIDRPPSRRSTSRAPRLPAVGSRSRATAYSSRSGCPRVVSLRYPNPRLVCDARDNTRTFCLTTPRTASSTLSRRLWRIWRNIGRKTSSAGSRGTSSSRRCSGSRRRISNRAPRPRRVRSAKCQSVLAASRNSSS